MVWHFVFIRLGSAGSFCEGLLWCRPVGDCVVVAEAAGHDGPASAVGRRHVGPAVVVPT